MRLALTLAVLAAIGLAAPALASVIANGDFESGLASWDYQGNASVTAYGDAWSAPYAGEYSARVGADSDPGLSWPESFIKQSFEVPSAGVLTFAYAFFSWDSLGYDEPGFVVTLDGAQILSESAPLEYEGAGPYTTGWRTFEYDLTGRSGVSELAFYAGNSDLGGALGDTGFQSWVYIDSVDVTAAPEPTSLALLAAACGAGSFVRRRRRR